MWKYAWMAWKQRYQYLFHAHFTKRYQSKQQTEKWNTSMTKENYDEIDANVFRMKQMYRAHILSEVFFLYAIWAYNHLFNNASTQVKCECDKLAKILGFCAFTPKPLNACSARTWVNTVGINNIYQHETRNILCKHHFTYTRTHSDDDTVVMRFIFEFHFVLTMGAWIFDSYGWFNC